LSTPAADEAQNRHVYTNRNTCITCNVITPEGNKCAYATTMFSRDFSHYILTCSGPDPSFVKVMTTSGFEQLQDWEPNTDLRERLKTKNIPDKRIFHVPVAGGNFSALVMMQLPSGVDFDTPDANQGKYPMLVRVYGGPGSIRISNTFGIGFQSYQVTTKKIIYVEIDGRGTAQKGIDMMFSVNNRLGTYEMEDQIAVAKFLADKYKFIDASRMAIWGW
jgi:dipeptidyl-peptidase 4